MSEKNSSLTRVAPLGEAILKNHRLVEALLQLLPRNPNITFGEFSDKDVFFSASPRKEKSLPPTKEHLTLIIEKIEHDEAFRNSIKELAIQSSTKKNRDNRILLFDLNPQTLAEAKKKIGKPYPNYSIKDCWHIFEGHSHPDLFIENENFILLIEGKRTEDSTKDIVTYLAHRSQMVRHIENAIAHSKGKKPVIAFYIVDEGCGYENKCLPDGLAEDLKKETIQKSEATNNAIIDSFYGYTTWQAVSKHLGICFPE